MMFDIVWSDCSLRFKPAKVPGMSKKLSNVFERFEHKYSPSLDFCALMAAIEEAYNFEYRRLSIPNPGNGEYPFWDLWHDVLGHLGELNRGGENYIYLTKQADEFAANNGQLVTDFSTATSEAEAYEIFKNIIYIEAHDTPAFDGELICFNIDW
jgi:hypothetical protein